MKETLIVGSGLAGLLTAETLLERGWDRLTMWDYEAPLTASKAPLAICHPFPGRTLKPHPLLSEAYRECRRWMTKWAQWDPHFVSEVAMMRPLDRPGADRLLRSHAEHWGDANPDWGKIWHDRDNNAIAYGPCFAVALGPLRDFWKARLEARDVKFDATLDPQHWKGPRVLCPGKGLGQWFPELELSLEGGELATFETGTPLDTLFSGGGVHLGPLKGNLVVGGSTRWSGDEVPSPELQIPALKEKLVELWPHLERVESIWQGMRTIHPVDRLPIAGIVPTLTDTWVVGALGSKGLLWGPLAARSVALNITDGAPVPHALSSERIDANAWRPA